MVPDTRRALVLALSELFVHDVVVLKLNEIWDIMNVHLRYNKHNLTT